MHNSAALKMCIFLHKYMLTYHSLATGERRSEENINNGVYTTSISLPGAGVSNWVNVAMVKITRAKHLEDLFISYLHTLTLILSCITYTHIFI